MGRKLQISFDNDENKFQLFGINTQLEDYQLASFINEYTNVKLNLLHEHHILESFIIFVDQKNEKKIILLKSQNFNKQIALEKLKSFDFLIIFSDDNNEEFVRQFQREEIFYTNPIKKDYLREKDIQIINQLFLLIN